MLSPVQANLHGVRSGVVDHGAGAEVSRQIHLHVVHTHDESGNSRRRGMSVRRVWPSSFQCGQAADVDERRAAGIQARAHPQRAGIDLIIQMLSYRPADGIEQLFGRDLGLRGIVRRQDGEWRQAAHVCLGWRLTETAYRRDAGELACCCRDQRLPAAAPLASRVATSWSTCSGLKMPAGPWGATSVKGDSYRADAGIMPCSVSWSIIRLTNSIWFADRVFPVRKSPSAAFAASLSRPTSDRTNRPRPSAACFA